LKPLDVVELVSNVADLANPRRGARPLDPVH
jgi:hypothetical protein